MILFILDALRRIMFILYEKRGHERQRINKNFSLEISIFVSWEWASKEKISGA